MRSAMTANLHGENIYRERNENRQMMLSRETIRGVLRCTPVAVDLGISCRHASGRVTESGFQINEVFHSVMQQSVK
jgi:hypothetical protein